MTTRTLRTSQDVDSLAVLLQQRKLPMTVSISEGVKRSTQQNRLQWKWAGECAEQIGGDADEHQAIFKVRFGIPILCAENVRFADAWTPAMNAMSYEQQVEFMRESRLPISSIMTAKQMGRYMDAIYNNYILNGVQLTKPDQP